MKVTVLWSPMLLAVALSPALLQCCNKTGNPNLVSLEVEAGGVNRLIGFDNATQEYSIWLNGASTLTIRAQAEDPGSRISWETGPTDYGTVATGSGAKTIAAPADGTTLVVTSTAPGCRYRAFSIAINPACMADECDDASNCTTDVCNSSVCEFTELADGTTCDFASVGDGIGICHQGICGRCTGASSWGDPHLVTYDGLTYDLQTVGEYILTCPPDPMPSGPGIDADCLNNGFGIQARTAAWPATQPVSVNVAIAANVGGDVVSIYAGDPDVFINHQRTALTGKIDLSQGGSVEDLGGGVVELVWPTSEVARVTRYASYLNLVVDANCGGQQLVGLLGNGDGDTENDIWPRGATSPLPSPTTLSFDELVHTFGDSWRITQSESLFEYGAGEDTGTYTDLSFPPGPATTASLPQAIRDAAETTCQNAGVVDSALLDACILDVGLTQDSSFTDVYSELTPPLVACSAFAQPIAAWSFSGNANDDTGNGNDGSVQGAVLTDDRFGNLTSAYSFDGSDVIDIGANVKPSFPFTFNVWIQPSNIDGNRGVMANDDVNGQGYYYGANVNLGSGQVHVGVGNGGFASSSSRRDFHTVDPVVNAGEWQMVTTVFASLTDMRVYVNGVQKPVVSSGGTGNGLAYSSASGKIGVSSRNGIWPPFLGEIDDVSVFDVALSDSEIQALYARVEPFGGTAP